MFHTYFLGKADDNWLGSPAKMPFYGCPDCRRSTIAFGANSADSNSFILSRRLPFYVTISRGPKDFNLTWLHNLRPIHGLLDWRGPFQKHAQIIALLWSSAKTQLKLERGKFQERVSSNTLLSSALHRNGTKRVKAPFMQVTALWLRWSHGNI